MLPSYTAEAWQTLPPAYFYMWRTPVSLEPMAAFQPSLPDFPPAFVPALHAPSPSYTAGNPAGLSVPTRVESSFYETGVRRPTLGKSRMKQTLIPGTLRSFGCHTVMLSASTGESRTFFLHRSVYDLVAAHPNLALTDSKLLGWYLSLSPEDRKLIQDQGGFHQFLLKHPALELYKHHIYAKYGAMPAQQTMIVNQQISKREDTREDKCGMIPITVRENLRLLSCSSKRSGQQEELCEERYHTGQQAHVPDGFHTACSSPIIQKPNDQNAHCCPGLPLLQLNEERQSWETGSTTAVWNDPAGLESFSLDMEVELHRQRRKPEPRSQISIIESPGADFHPSQSEWPPVTKQSSSKYHSIDSIPEDGAQHTDGSLIRSVKLAQATSLLGPAEKNATEGVNQDKEVHGTKYGADNDDDGTRSSFEDQGDTFHSLMEDKSILVCLASDIVAAQNGEVQSRSSTINSATLATSSETSKSVQSPTKVKTAEKHTSPIPCVPTCDAMVNTEMALHPSAFTQTQDPETADKDANTEVYMADLDYIAKEFIKLKNAQQLTDQKAKSSGCKLRKECECRERAEQAELALLALQYSMCRQHCWALYYSAEGSQLTSVPKDPPPNILNVLQKLGSDYDQMKNKIQAGVPLQQLKPLSVDSGKIITGASYIPAQIIGDVLGGVSSGSSQEPQNLNEDGGCPDNQSRSGLQVGQKKEKRVKKENSRIRRAAMLIPQEQAAGEEVSTNEAWYDAEEDLELPGAIVATAVEQVSSLKTVHVSDESASEEANISVICVSNLRSNVTESDVRLLFEKYHVSEVRISTLKNLRVAIVKLSGPQSAEAAVRDLNGCQMRGCTLHLEHIDGTMSSSQASVSACGPDSTQDTAKPQTSKTDSGNTERKLIIQPPVRPDIKRKMVVSISPTAKGTCVPQYYGTMSGFDILMAELTQRHPEVGKRRIMDALTEVRANHRGALVGLPLSTIREMTSELLTRPPTATES